MNLSFQIIIFISIFILIAGCSKAENTKTGENTTQNEENQDIIHLPQPDKEGGGGLHKILNDRRSIRSYVDGEITKEELSQILWSGDGISYEERAFRTAPSAGALYPIDIFVFNEEGVFRYEPQDHYLKRVQDEDRRDDLYTASLSQGAVRDADTVLVLMGFVERTSVKYGDRALRYVYIEGGHICQNILLEVENLGLGAVPIGAFHDEQILEILSLEDDVVPVFVIPIGRVEGE